MTEFVRFRCNNCGHRFETEVLSEGERREARERNQPPFTSPLPSVQENRYQLRLGVVEFMKRAPVR